MDQDYKLPWEYQKLEFRKVDKVKSIAFKIYQ